MSWPSKNPKDYLASEKKLSSPLGMSVRSGSARHQRGGQVQERHILSAGLVLGVLLLVGGAVGGAKPVTMVGAAMLGFVVLVGLTEVLSEASGPSDAERELSARRRAHLRDRQTHDPSRRLLDRLEEVEAAIARSEERERQSLERLEAAAASGEQVEGEVTEVIKNKGLVLDMDGVRGFLPASHTEFDRVELDAFVGRRLKCRVIEFNRADTNVVLSRRAMLEEKGAREPAEERTPSNQAGERARRELRDQLDDAADVLGSAAERCLAAHHGPNWLAHVNARREDANASRSLDNRLRAFEPGEVRGDPRAALSVIGWDPAFEPTFGRARGKAKFLHGVANKLHHRDQHQHIDEAELAEARRALRELCDVARRLPADS